MHVLKTDFHGNANVGLYGYCTEYNEQRLCLLGERLNPEQTKAVSAALGSTIEQQSIAGTPMTGIFLAGNSHALLVPSIIFDKEFERLEALGLPVQRFDTTLTCLGNNILVNDTGCLVSPEFSDEEMAQLTKIFKVPVKRIEIAGTQTPGACVVLNGKRGLIHRDAQDFEIEMVKSTLGLESLEPSSVNLGSPYLKAGIITSRHGFVIGNQSGGPEIVHAEESLGYLEEKDE